MPGPAAVPFDEDVENAFDRFLDDYIPRNLDEVCTQQKIVSELIQQRNRNRAAGVPEEIPDKFRQRAKAVIQRLKLRKTLPPLQLGENTFDKRYYEGRPKIERKFFCVYDTSSLPPRIVFKYSDPSREKTWARAEEAIVKSRFIGVSFDDGTGRYNWCNGLWPNKKQCKQNMEGEKQDKPGGKRELFAAIRRETAGLLRHVASGRSAGKFKGNFGGGLPGEELMDEFKVTAEEVNKQVQIAREWYAENSVMNR